MAALVPLYILANQEDIPHFIWIITHNYSVMSNSTKSTGFLCPWNSRSKNTGVSGHSLLQGIFLMQGSNLAFLHCRQILNHWAAREAHQDYQFSSVQLLSRVWLFATPWTAACQASLSFTNSQSLLRFISIESVILSNHLILSRPLLLLPSIFPSIRVFSSESVLRIRRPKDWSFNFSISPSNECSELTSFRMDWLDLPAVQGTLKSLL